HARGEARRFGGFGSVPRAVDHRNERPDRRRPHDAEIARLMLGSQRRAGDSPRDDPAVTLDATAVEHRGHPTNFLIVTVVPLPTCDVISNSSISRLDPGRPMPRPLPVE